MEKFERISDEDKVPEQEKESFAEMQRLLETDKSEISDDPMLVQEIEKMIDSLPNDREKEIIRRRYFGGETFDSIGQSFGLSGNRIREIEVVAMKRLRRPKMRAYVEGVDLVNRSKSEYNEILGKLISDYMDKPQVRDNTEVKKILQRIYTRLTSYSSYWPAGLYRLDSVKFNETCDLLKKILNKEIYTNLDIDDLNNFETKLHEEVGRVLGRDSTQTERGVL